MHVRRRGFTLIEALVVAGIAAVAVALLMPALNKARKQAERIQMKSTLVTIGVAIEQYKNDHRGYPRVPGNPNPVYRGYDGAVVLCRALFGPVAKTPRDRPGGPTQTKVTYVKSEDFETTKLPNGTPVLLDRFGFPILYFPASMAPVNLRVATAEEPHPYVCHVSDVNTRYDVRDNTGPAQRKEEWDASFYRQGDPSGFEPPEARMRRLLGDTHGPGGAGTPPDGLIQADETSFEKPFLLWSAGPDGQYGADADPASCDDVTDFR